MSTEDKERYSPIVGFVDQCSWFRLLVFCTAVLAAVETLEHYRHVAVAWVRCVLRVSFSF